MARHQRLRVRAFKVRTSTETLVDAIKTIADANVERRPVKLDLCDYPYLPAANVKTTSAADYMALMSGSAA